MNSYRGILMTDYMIDIPTNPEELATLLDSYALDWSIVLDFLDTVSSKRGIELNKEEVVKIMKRKYE